MADSADLNLLYQEWLDIPANRCPPNHYALLGVDDFENDIDAIELAAKSRGVYLHQIASGPNRKIVQDMLGQVAIARRTLLDQESKSRYDDSLRNAGSDPKPSHESAADSNVQKQAGDIGAAEAEPTIKNASQASGPSGLENSSSNKGASRRKKKSDLRYHFASAAVLLALVGLIAFFNRGKGGRQASQVQDSSSVSTPQPETERGSVAAKKSDSGKKSATGKTSAASKDSAASAMATKPSRKSARKSGASPAGKPAARFEQPQNTRSSGLAGVMPGGMQLDYSSIGSGATAKGGFVPMGGVKKGPARKDIAGTDWPTQLVKVPGFPKAIEELFDCDQGFNWFNVKDDQLILKPKMKQANFLVSKKTKLSKGQAVSITTSVSKGMSSEVRAGISVGRIQIGLKPSKNGVNVYMKEFGGNDDSITTLENPSTPIQLLIQRNPESTDRLEWFARSGEQIVTGYVDGTFDDQPAEVRLYARGARKGRKHGPVIRDWMVPTE